MLLREKSRVVYSDENEKNLEASRGANNCKCNLKDIRMRSMKVLGGCPSNLQL